MMTTKESSPSSSTTTQHQNHNVVANNNKFSSTSTTTTTMMNSAGAGYVAGISGVVIGHPLDSLKVWLQTNTTGTNKHMINSSTTTTNIIMSGVSSSCCGASSSSSRRMGTTTAAATTTTLRNTDSTTGGGRMTSIERSTMNLKQQQQSMIRSIFNTIRALYSGVSGPLVTVGIVQSINFTIYDATRRILYNNNNNHHNNNIQSNRDYLYNDSLMNVAISGFLSGFGLAFVTSPLIMIKTQQQVTGHGFRQAMKESLFYNNNNNDGYTNTTNKKINTLRRCFTGFPPHLICETLGRSIYYVVYESLKRYVSSYNNNHNNQVSVSLLERVVCAGMAGITCWAFIYPFDTMRNRLYYYQQQQKGQGRVLLSTMEMIRTLHAERAFYRGFGITVLRAGPVAAIVLPVYDLVLEKLS